jgi:hypothetical protein
MLTGIGCARAYASEQAGSHPKARCAVQSVASVFVFTEKPWKKMWKKQGAPQRRRDPSEARINARACKPTSCGRVHRRGGPEEEEKALGACSWRFGRTKLSISCSQACTRSRMQFQGPVLGSLYVSVWVGACIRQHTSCAALVHMRANV